MVNVRKVFSWALKISQNPQSTNHTELLHWYTSKLRTSHHWKTQPNKKLHYKLRKTICSTHNLVLICIMYKNPNKSMRKRQTKTKNSWLAWSCFPEVMVSLSILIESCVWYMKKNIWLRWASNISGLGTILGSWGSLWVGDNYTTKW